MMKGIYVFGSFDDVAKEMKKEFVPISLPTLNVGTPGE